MVQSPALSTEARGQTGEVAPAVVCFPGLGQAHAQGSASGAPTALSKQCAPHVCEEEHIAQGLPLLLVSGQSGVFPKSLPGKKREFRFHPIKETVVEEPVDITPYLDQLDESLRDKVLQLQKGRWELLSQAFHLVLSGVAGWSWRGRSGCMERWLKLHERCFCSLGWEVWAGSGAALLPSTPRSPSIGSEEKNL